MDSYKQEKQKQIKSYKTNLGECLSSNKLLTMETDIISPIPFSYFISMSRVSISGLCVQVFCIADAFLKRNCG